MRRLKLQLRLPDCDDSLCDVRGRIDYAALLPNRREQYMARLGHVYGRSLQELQCRANGLMYRKLVRSVGLWGGAGLHRSVGDKPDRPHKVRRRRNDNRERLHRGVDVRLWML